VKSKAHNIAVIYAPGTNCHEETMYALTEILGMKSHLVIVDDKKGIFSKSLKGFTGLVIPGGFSYGDHFGAGRVLSTVIRQRLVHELNEFIAQNKRILGICNGFQVLTQLGMLPGALVGNRSGRLESRWVNVKAPQKELWHIDGTQNETFYLPVSHREGRIVFPDNIAVCPAFYYVDKRNTRTLVYPENPAGSPHAIAGIFAHSKHVLGMMPHPERAVSPEHKSQDGLIILKGFFMH